jgi:hypothetical protein
MMSSRAATLALSWGTPCAAVLRSALRSIDRHSSASDLGCQHFNSAFNNVGDANSIVRILKMRSRTSGESNATSEFTQSCPTRRDPPCVHLVSEMEKCNAPIGQ